MPLRSTIISDGPVRGVPCGNPIFTVYRGIPYAAPTSGMNRFRAPQKPESWKEERLCDTFSDICMQDKLIGGMPFSDFFLKEFYPYAYRCSEDSLYLNVWTPAQKMDEKLPVMFWIHGGGLGSGYGHEMEFDGEAFCKTGVILVTINYRVNFFGFFAHPDLSAENEHHVSGNYGFLDQVAALRWVHENISAFGGDPENVTIFGQSAGGGSVISHLISRLSDGLFKKAIIESGSYGITTYAMGSTFESGVEWGRKACDVMGKNIEELRMMDADDLLNQFQKAEKAIGPLPKQLKDGYVFEEAPGDALLKGNWKNVPIIAGSVSGDRELMLGGIGIAVKKGLRPEDACIAGDSLIGIRQASDGRVPSYIYYFEPDIPGHNADGFVKDGTAYHSSELWYVFGTLSRCWRHYDGRHYDLSNTMIRYWTNFAKTGNPNSDDVPEWLPFTNDSELEMVLTDKGCSCRRVEIADTVRKAFMVNE